jgi:hypothetical protein
MDRRGKLLLMRDVLEHLGACFDEWQLADSRSEPLLADSIERDLHEFQRLCLSLRPSPSLAT